MREIAGKRRRAGSKGMVAMRDRRWVMREECHCSEIAVGREEAILTSTGGCLKTSCLGYPEVLWLCPSSMLRKELRLENLIIAWTDKVSLAFQWHSRESRITANAGA
jgi:hypothetical protein